MQNARDSWIAFTAELDALNLGYLHDESVTRENMDWSGLVDDSDAYYVELLSVAKNEVGMRCEERGIDINALLGRVIY